MTDYKKLCAELVYELEGWVAYGDEIDIANAHVLIDRACDALASVTEQPSDEEIMGLMPQQMHEDLAYAARAMANEAGTDSRKAKGFMRIALNRHVVDLAHAVLARWGTSNLAEVRSSLGDGEVAELVAWLQEEADDYDCIGCADSASKCNRAAELLQELENAQ